MSKRIAKNILLVGWGSAEWNIVKKLMAEGKMPNTQSLVEKGEHGLLGASDPSVHAAQWTNLVTGKIPAQHGIFSMLDGDNPSLPAAPKSRKAKAIWNILSEKGLKAHQVGCWASHPAETINGVSVSDRFTYNNNENSVAPAQMFQEFNQLKVTPQSISTQQLKAFVPSIEQIDVEDTKTAKTLLQIKTFIAHSLSVFNATKHILNTQQDWDFVSTFFNDLSVLKHQFMPYFVEPENDIDLKDVVPAAYHFLDNLLGELIAFTQKDTHIFVVSQSGYLDDKKWITQMNDPQDRWEFNTQGIFIRRNQFDKQLKQLFALTASDIVPTILVSLGLPPSQDIPGKVLVFQQVEKIIGAPVPTYEDGTVSDLEATITPETEQIFKDLAYNASHEQHEYFKARMMNTVGGQAEAAPIFEKYWKKYPENVWFGARLAGCYLALNKLDELKITLDQVLANNTKDIAEVRLIKASVCVAEMKMRSAAQQLELAEKQVGKIREMYAQIGHHYNNMKEWALAQKAFKKELEIYESPAAYISLALTFFQRKRYNLAVEPLERLLEMMPNHYLGHFYLGSALMHTQKFQESVAHFEKVLQLPNVPENIKQQANQARVKIYRDDLKDHAKLKEMQEAYEKSIGSKGDMIIVSGLPRSGTSMMMQMLVNAGLQPFTDGLRTADDNNKKGYYEHEAIKNLAKDKRVLAEVGDKVVKIISHLLPHLPHVYNYKIVFMDRPIEEVLTSQHKMLGRLDKAKALEESMKLSQTFEKNRNEVREWAKKSRNVEMIEIPYHEAMVQPLKYAQAVKEFLKLENADERKMAATIDPSLYRERADEINA